MTVSQQGLMSVNTLFKMVCFQKMIQFKMIASHPSVPSPNLEVCNMNEKLSDLL